MPRVAFSAIPELAPRRSEAVGCWQAAGAPAAYAGITLPPALCTVGISNGTRTIEVLATGLISGSGTKPLHDRVTLISKTGGG